MGIDNNVVRFELADGVIDIDLKVLEDMKQAMLLFFSKPKEEFPIQYLENKSYFKQELESFAVMILDNIPRIGAWRLENDNGELVLVRYPRPGMHGYITFHATIKLKDSKWEVVSLLHEREFGPAE